ncbi:unnamed protein product [Arctia plantaginis]|uniref:Uncharacterized protein n=1 Tax=Arctia plantaginis TaxID=874455 RepID=A0A8S1BJX6_ARCPL|nr:unnamed protein product [Arctia plantaginis]
MATSFGVENEAYTDTEIENKPGTHSEVDIEILYTNGIQKSIDRRREDESEGEGVEDFVRRLKGCAFISMSEKKTKKSWRRQSLSATDNYNKEQPL